MTREVGRELDAIIDKQADRGLNPSTIGDIAYHGVQSALWGTRMEPQNNFPAMVGPEFGSESFEDAIDDLRMEPMMC